MTTNNTYAKTALQCVENFQKTNCIKELWAKYVKENFNTKAAQEKSCPKSAFLGLCEDGYIKNIPKGNYTKSIKNKQYAIQAIDILKQPKTTIITPTELWKKIGLVNKTHNSQMDVVIALWNQGYISDSK